MAKVSVIVPAWGDTPLLTRAKESILSQTHGDVELVVAAPPEDGPQTAIAARWTALERAKGDWIAFCDADDWLEPNAIEEMMQTAQQCDADCVCCGISRDGADGRTLRRHADLLGPSDTYNSLCNKIFKRGLLDALVIDKSVTLGEDLMMTAQAIRKAHKVAVLDKPFYHYCENAASVTHKQDGRKRIEDLVKVADILRSAMPEPEFADFHDRLIRDALLLWLRFRIFDRALWRAMRSRMSGGILADSRHGMIKKGVLILASCIFD